MATNGAMFFAPKGDKTGREDGRKHRYVLICHPNRKMCKTIAQVVNTLGVQAVAATDGSAAIRLSLRRTPDLVLFEENMPGMRAMDFLDAGLSGLLNKRAMMIPHATANRPRWLPTVVTPLEIGRFQRDLNSLLETSKSS